MSDIAAPGGLGRPLLIFTLLHIAANGAIFGVEAATGVTLPQVLGIVVLYFSAFIAGRSFGKAAGRAMTGGEALRFGLWALAITAVMAVALFYVIFRQAGLPLTPDMVALAIANGDPGLAKWIWAILAAGAVITALLAGSAAAAGSKHAIRNGLRA